MTRIDPAGRAEAGFTLVELVVVMIILSIVLAGLGGMFVAASNAQIDLNRRFEAQQQARQALDKLRREIHCASSIVLGPNAGASGSSPNAALTLQLPAACATGTGAVTWCARTLGNAYGLYRVAPSVGTCTGGELWGQYLRTPTPFTYAAPTAGALPKLGVSFPVQLQTGAGGLYKLEDDVVLRNGFRS